MKYLIFRASESKKTRTAPIAGGFELIAIETDRENALQTVHNAQETDATFRKSPIAAMFGQLSDFTARYIMVEVPDYEIF